MININQLKDALKNENITYLEESEGLLLRHHSEKYNFENFVILNVFDDDEYVHICCFAFTFEEITRSVLSLVNELNGRFKFFSFHVNDKKCLLVKTTAIVKENNSVEEVIELIARACYVMDDIYPDVQRVIWK